ncbi:MAG: PAS domain-containing protein [Rhodomicrobium sp.]
MPSDTRQAGSMESARAVLEAILQTASEAIIATDREGRVTFWNPGAARIWHCSGAPRKAARLWRSSVIHMSSSDRPPEPFAPGALAPNKPASRGGSVDCRNKPGCTFSVAL